MRSQPGCPADAGSGPPLGLCEVSACAGWAGAGAQRRGGAPVGGHWVAGQCDPTCSVGGPSEAVILPAEVRLGWGHWQRGPWTEAANSWRSPRDGGAKEPCGARHGSGARVQWGHRGWWLVGSSSSARLRLLAPTSCVPPTRPHRTVGGLGASGWGGAPPGGCAVQSGPALTAACQHLSASGFQGDKTLPK